MIALVPLAVLLMALQHAAPDHSPIATQVYASMGSRGSNCSGSGICSIGTSGGQAPAPTGYKAALGYDKEGRLYLEFEYANLPPAVVSAQFGNDSFQMQSDCPIPAAVLRSIASTDTTLALKEGVYALLKNIQTVRIMFVK